MGTFSGGESQLGYSITCGAGANDIRTHVAELLRECQKPIVKLPGIHAENASAEGERELHASTIRSVSDLQTSGLLSNKGGQPKLLTNTIVTTVKSMMDRPCFNVSFACLTASWASITPACCCLRVRRSLSCESSVKLHQPFSSNAYSD